MAADLGTAVASRSGGSVRGRLMGRSSGVALQGRAGSRSVALEGHSRDGSATVRLDAGRTTDSAGTVAVQSEASRGSSVARLKSGSLTRCATVAALKGGRAGAVSIGCSRLHLRNECLRGAEDVGSVLGRGARVGRRVSGGWLEASPVSAAWCTSRSSSSVGKSQCLSAAVGSGAVGLLLRLVRLLLRCRVGLLRCCVRLLLGSAEEVLGQGERLLLLLLLGCVALGCRVRLGLGSRLSLTLLGQNLLHGGYGSVLIG